MPYFHLANGIDLEVPEGMDFETALDLAMRQSPESFGIEVKHGGIEAFKAGAKESVGSSLETLGRWTGSEGLTQSGHEWKKPDDSYDAYRPTTDADKGAGAWISQHITEPFMGAMGSYAVPTVAGAIAAPVAAAAAPGVAAAGLIGSGLAFTAAATPAEAQRNIEEQQAVQQRQAEAGQQVQPIDTAAADMTGVVQAALLPILGGGVSAAAKRTVVKWLGPDIAAVTKAVASGQMTKEAAVKSLQSNASNYLLKTGEMAAMGVPLMVGTEALRMGQAGEDVLSEEAKARYLEASKAAIMGAPVFGLHGAMGMRGRQIKGINKASEAFASTHADAMRENAQRNEAARKEKVWADGTGAQTGLDLGTPKQPKGGRRAYEETLRPEEQVPEAAQQYTPGQIEATLDYMKQRGATPEQLEATRAEMQPQPVKAAASPVITKLMYTNIPKGETRDLVKSFEGESLGDYDTVRDLYDQLAPLNEAGDVHAARVMKQLEPFVESRKAELNPEVELTPESEMRGTGDWIKEQEYVDKVQAGKERAAEQRAAEQRAARQREIDANTQDRIAYGKQKEREQINETEVNDAVRNVQAQTKQEDMFNHALSRDDMTAPKVESHSPDKIESVLEYMRQRGATQEQLDAKRAEMQPKTVPKEDIVTSPRELADRKAEAYEEFQKAYEHYQKTGDDRALTEIVARAKEELGPYDEYLNQRSTRALFDKNGRPTPGARVKKETPAPKGADRAGDAVPVPGKTPTGARPAAADATRAGSGVPVNERPAVGEERVNAPVKDGVVAKVSHAKDARTKLNQEKAARAEAVKKTTLADQLVATDAQKKESQRAADAKEAEQYLPEVTTTGLGRAGKATEVDEFAPANYKLNAEEHLGKEGRLIPEYAALWWNDLAQMAHDIKHGTPAEKVVAREAIKQGRKNKTFTTEQLKNAIERDKKNIELLQKYKRKAIFERAAEARGEQKAALAGERKRKAELKKAKEYIEEQMAKDAEREAKEKQADADAERHMTARKEKPAELEATDIDEAGVVSLRDLDMPDPDAFMYSKSKATPKDAHTPSGLVAHVAKFFNSTKEALGKIVTVVKTEAELPLRALKNARLSVKTDRLGLEGIAKQLAQVNEKQFNDIWNRIFVKGKSKEDMQQHFEAEMTLAQDRMRGDIDSAIKNDEIAPKDIDRLIDEQIEKVKAGAMVPFTQRGLLESIARDHSASGRNRYAQTIAERRSHVLRAWESYFDQFDTKPEDYLYVMQDVLAASRANTLDIPSPPNKTLVALTLARLEEKPTYARFTVEYDRTAYMEMERRGADVITENGTWHILRGEEDVPYLAGVSSKAWCTSGGHAEHYMVHEGNAFAVFIPNGRERATLAVRYQEAIEPTGKEATAEQRAQLQEEADKAADKAFEVEQTVNKLDQEFRQMERLRLDLKDRYDKDVYNNTVDENKGPSDYLTKSDLEDMPKHLRRKIEREGVIAAYEYARVEKDAAWELWNIAKEQRSEARRKLRDIDNQSTDVEVERKILTEELEKADADVANAERLAEASLQSVEPIFDLHRSGKTDAEIERHVRDVLYDVIPVHIQKDISRRGFAKVFEEARDANDAAWEAVSDAKAIRREIRGELRDLEEQRTATEAEIHEVQDTRNNGTVAKEQELEFAALSELIGVDISKHTNVRTKDEYANQIARSDIIGRLNAGKPTKNEAIVSAFPDKFSLTPDGKLRAEEYSLFDSEAAVFIDRIGEIGRVSLVGDDVGVMADIGYSGRIGTLYLDEHPWDVSGTGTISARYKANAKNYSVYLESMKFAAETLRKNGATIDRVVAKTADVDVTTRELNRSRTAGIEVEVSPEAMRREGIDFPIRKKVEKIDLEALEEQYDVRYSKDGHIQGLAKAGKVWLVSDNISKSDVEGVATHEIGAHVGFDKVLAKGDREHLASQVRSWIGGEDKVASDAATAAVKRAPKGSHDELIAYTVEELNNRGVQPTASTAAGKWLQKVMTAFNNALKKLGLRKDITAQELVDLAYGAAKLQIDPKKAERALDKVIDKDARAETKSERVKAPKEPDNAKDAENQYLDADGKMSRYKAGAPKKDWGNTLSTSLEAAKSGDVKGVVSPVLKKAFGLDRNDQSMGGWFGNKIISSGFSWQQKSDASDIGTGLLNKITGKITGVASRAAALNSHSYTEDALNSGYITLDKNGVAHVVKDAKVNHAELVKADRKLRDVLLSKAGGDKDTAAYDHKVLWFLPRDLALIKDHIPGFPEESVPQSARDHLAKLLADPEIKAEYDKANEIRKTDQSRMIDFDEMTGRISKEEAAKYRDRPEYFAMYREMEESGALLSDPQFSNSLLSGKYQHKLKGGDHLLGDPIDNLMHNSIWRIKTGLMTKASNAVIDDMVQIGAATKTSQAHAKDANVVEIRREGENAYYRIKDMNDMSVFAANPVVTGRVFEVMRTATNWLRTGVTMTPGFAYRQLWQDAQHAMLVGGNSMSLAETMKIGASELAANIKGESARAKKLRSFGVTGARDSGETFDHWLRTVEGDNNSTFSKFRTHAHRLANASDVAARAMVFEAHMRASKAKGIVGHEAEAAAAHAARMMMNFNDKGNSRSLAYLLGVVPFLNPRIQGNYRFVEAIRGNVPGMTKADGRKAVLTKLSTMAVATAIYSMVNSEDEEYERAGDSDKQNNFLFDTPFGGLKIPVAQEIAPLKIAVEIAVRKLMGNEHQDWGKDKQAIMHVLNSEMFGFSTDMVPTLIKPTLENLTNHSFLTGKPLESAHMTALEPHLRKTSGTSEIAVRAAERLSAMGIEVSPIKLDNFIRGTFGSMATEVANASNVIAAVAGENREPMTANKLPIVGPAFYSKRTDQTRSDLQDVLLRVQQVNSSYKELLKQDPKEAEVYRKEHLKQLAAVGWASSLQQRLSEISTQRKVAIAAGRDPERYDKMMQAVVKQANVAKRREELL